MGLSEGRKASRTSPVNGGVSESSVGSNKKSSGKDSTKRMTSNLPSIKSLSSNISDSLSGKKKSSRSMRRSRGSLGHSSQRKRLSFGKKAMEAAMLDLDKSEDAADEAFDNNIIQMQLWKVYRAIAAIVFFFIFGVVFYHTAENMKVYDAFYFIILTITTVGYGDVYPTSTWGKIVTCFFVFAGLALLAETLNIVQDYVIERINKAARKAAREAAIKEKENAQLAAQKEQDEGAQNALRTVLKNKEEEKRKESLSHRRSTTTGTFATLVNGIVSVGAKANQSKIENRRSSLTKQLTLKRLTGDDGHGRKTSISQLSPAQLAQLHPDLLKGVEAATSHQSGGRSGFALLSGRGKSSLKLDIPEASPENNGSWNTPSPGGNVSDGGTVDSCSPNNSSGRDTPDAGAGAGAELGIKVVKDDDPELVALLEDFKEAQAGKMKIIRSLIYIMISIASGAIFYHNFPGEKMEWIDALYMACITVTSVGYGDIKPKTYGGKVFAMFWIVTGTTLVAKAIGGYLEIQTAKKQKELRTRILAKPLTHHDVEMADIDGSGSLSEAEFVLFKLQAMGILEVSDVEKVTRKFRVELNPGSDGEVQIPTEKYLQECLVKGMDYQFAMSSYQDNTEQEKMKEKNKEDERNAEFTINKRKLGLFKGAINKILVKVDEMEVLRTSARDGGVVWDENDHKKLRQDIVTVSKMLPAVEVSALELREEVRVMKLRNAKEELKRLQESKITSHLSEDEKKAIQEQKQKISTQKAASKVMAIVQSNRRKTVALARGEDLSKVKEIAP